MWHQPFQPRVIDNRPRLEITIPFLLAEAGEQGALDAIYAASRNNGNFLYYGRPARLIMDIEPDAPPVGEEDGSC
jgi:hypothetical protein